MSVRQRVDAILQDDAFVVLMRQRHLAHFLRVNVMIMSPDDVHLSHLILTIYDTVLCILKGDAALRNTPLDTLTLFHLIAFIHQNAIHFRLRCSKLLNLFTSTLIFELA